MNQRGSSGLLFLNEHRLYECRLYEHSRALTVDACSLKSPRLYKICLESHMCLARRLLKWVDFPGHKDSHIINLSKEVSDYEAQDKKSHLYT